jgi:hypothetical protein
MHVLYKKCSEIMDVARSLLIFVSYHRGETSDFAGRLADSLCARFGTQGVFFDVETIEPGAVFPDVILRAVSECTLLIPIIGPGWLSETDQKGKRRLSDRRDFVRLEIKTALALGKQVIPVLVEDTPMPRRQDLPRDIAGLADRRGLHVRRESLGATLAACSRPSKMALLQVDSE